MMCKNVHNASEILKQLPKQYVRYVCVCAPLLSYVRLFATPLDSSSVHGIPQARRVLECAAISSSRESSLPRDWTPVSYVSSIIGEFFTAEPPGKPMSSMALFFSKKSSWMYVYINTMAMIYVYITMLIIIVLLSTYCLAASILSLLGRLS